MSKFLKKYQLTSEGKKLKKIHLLKNRQGDPNMEFPVKNLNDDQAALLFLRKDGRGQKYIEVATKATAKTTVSK